MRRDLIAAGVLGAGAGLRSFAVPAVLGAQNRGPFPGPARSIAFGAALGEIIADKQPDTASRWAPRGLILRLGFGVPAGFALAGVDGAVSAGLATLAAARVGSLVRGAITDSSAARAAAFAEDLLAYALVSVGSRAGGGGPGPTDQDHRPPPDAI